VSQEEDEAPGPVVIPRDQLSPQAVSGLIQEFVTRDGTDYGAVERTLDEKIARLETQLAKGDAVIVFDPATESVNIVLTRKLGPEMTEG
jgi:uncharacterized protein YheU (UPF0270 family)